MQKKTLSFSLILLIGASLSIWLMLMRDAKSTTTKQPNAVNAFMTNPVYIEYNKQGQIHSKLNAKKMQHYEKDDTSIFTKPRVLIYTDDHIPWYIRSHYGKSMHGTKEVLLYDRVKLFQPQQTNHPKTTIITSDLMIHPDKSLATTNKKVTVKQPGTVIKGKGIRANFKKSIFRLISQSNGVYTPTLQKQS